MNKHSLALTLVALATLQVCAQAQTAGAPSPFSVGGSTVAAPAPRPAVVKPVVVSPGVATPTTPSVTATVAPAPAPAPAAAIPVSAPAAPDAPASASVVAAPEPAAPAAAAAPVEVAPAAAAVAPVAPAPVGTRGPVTAPVASGTKIAAEAPVQAEPRIIVGNDRVIAAPKPFPAIEGAAMAFKFEEAPISEVIHVVMKDVVKADYVLHGQVAGTVTLSTQTDVSPDHAVLLLESALQANGLSMIRDSRGTFHIGRPDALRGIFPTIRQVVAKSPLPPGSGAIIVPLQYIGANEMASILRPMLPPDALVRVDSVRNLLVLAGNRTQAEGWLDVVSTFDVNLLKGMSVGVFPLKYATIKEVEMALRLMSGSAGAAAANAAPGAAGVAAGVAGNAPGSSSAATGGLSGSASSSGSSVALSESFPLFGAVRIMPIERMNSILVVTPRVAYLEEARLWIERLDKPSSNSGESQLFVYPVQNGSAKHLASVIGGLFGGSSTTGNSNSGVAPSLGSSSQSSGLGSSSSGAGLTLGTNLNRTANTNQTTPVSAVTLAPGLRMIADDINNAVLVYGNRNDFMKIEAALKRLDVPPTQVLIEATIIEVTLGDSLQYGLQGMFSGKGVNGGTGTGVLSTATDGSLSSAVQGFSYTLKNSAGNIQGVLSALASKSLLKVISSPSLMVLDNHTANITVGTQQPVQTASTIITGGAVSNSIQYKDTGVNLTVTPSVNAGNMVTMDLVQSVSDVGAKVDSATGQFPFNQRQITSKLAVRSGEYIVMGGLIRDNNSSGSSGLPLLSSIPVVGGLFGTRTSTQNRTELLVVLTPRVVRSDQEVRDVSEELRDRMKGFTGFEALSILPSAKAGTHPALFNEAGKAKASP